MTNTGFNGGGQEKSNVVSNRPFYIYHLIRKILKNYTPNAHWNKPEMGV
ncbi:hypothetical protein GGGNBK_21265 [Sporosarcina sp. ANT_H38]|nr:hypothetical protein [Sporosarcina sp. ANT_H38]